MIRWGRFGHLLVGSCMAAVACTDAAAPPGYIQPPPETYAADSQQLSRPGVKKPLPPLRRPPQKLVRHEKKVSTSRYIVVLEESAIGEDGLDAVVESLARTYEAKRRKTYRTALHGFAAEMDPRAAEKLSQDPRVAFVEEEGFLSQVGSQSSPVNWGLDRIDQTPTTQNGTYNWRSTGAGVTAYVIDGRVRTTHTDFGGRASFGVDTTGSGGDPDGHGSNVAGIIGGTVSGVAKDVKIVSVQVCVTGSGCTISDVAEGIDWVTANASGPSVVNMSLGGPDSFWAIHNAAQAAVSAGIVFVKSAGNDNVDNCSQAPQDVTDVIVVGALEPNDTKWASSNFGACVKIYAPGVGITTVSNTSDTLMGNAWTGTSQASPHVAGAAALFLAAFPGSTPAQVKGALLANMTPNSSLPNSAGMLNTSFIREQIDDELDGYQPPIGRIELGGGDVASYYLPASNSFAVTSALLGSETPNSTTTWGNWQGGKFFRTGDYNGDGLQDWSWYAPWANSFLVMLSNGSGGYTTTQTNTSGWGNWQGGSFFRTGDYNGDGKTDWSWYADWSNDFIVMLSNGAGGYTEVHNSTSGWGNWKSGSFFRTGDYNGDGKTDWSWYAPWSNKFIVMLSNGSGGYTSVETNTSGWGNWQNGKFFRTGDYNGDGKTDWSWYAPWSNKFIVMLSNGAGSYTSFETSTSAWGNWSGSTTFLVGDYNGDGKTDWSWYVPWSNSIMVMLSNGAGGFTTMQPSTSALGNLINVFYFRALDVNGDGRTDWSYYDWTVPQFVHLISDGSGGFSATPVTTPNVGLDAASFYRTGSFRTAPPLAKGEVFIDESLPPGAITDPMAESWSWQLFGGVSGLLGHLSPNTVGMHQHSFTGATEKLFVGSNDVLYTYVKLDPTTPPTEIMLAWKAGAEDWRRAYWGANSITLGTDGTSTRLYQGPLPATGQWVRLEVNAADVALNGRAVDGMGFLLYGGKASWDYSGKAGGRFLSATYNSTFKAPTCGASASCDSGTLLNGRGSITGGAEPNQPNTLSSLCADGYTGTYHVDESIDRLKIMSLDGSSLKGGRLARVEAKIWAYSTADQLDIYYASSTSSSVWTLIQTLTPAGSGAQTLTANVPLAAVTGNHVIRASLRYGGTASTCNTDPYGDRDDLVFGVQ